MQKLEKLEIKEKIEYFNYSNLKIKEPDFCPLFAQNKVCHEMENLNCYLCGCPNFRFNDEGFREINGKKVLSYCSIDSKDGRVLETPTAFHQDCSNCQIPHHQKFIEKNFDNNWLEIMNQTNN